jgi:hypothetical protein
MLYPRPFENNDDLDRETDLDEFPSPEFEALAEQLADDARMLAERYPAPALAPLHALASTGEQRPSTEIGSARWPRWRKIVAASVLVAAAIGAWYGTRPGDKQGEWAVDARQVDQRRANQDRRDTNPVVDDLQPVGRQPLPAISFQEFTGPEQEAVLDLLEENALSQGSLSI